MTSATASDPAAPEVEDFTHIDAAALAAELDALAKEIRAHAGQDDIDHLQRIQRWGRLCTALGYGTAWMAPNPLSALLMSQGLLTRWLLTHHISHRSYDRVPGIPEHYTSKVFARGRRRLRDWMDWILPEAWHEEHDFLHHYNLGEDEDPDLLERNTAWMDEKGLLPWQRTALVAVLSVTWKWVYYAPSTWRALERAEARRARQPEPERIELLDPRSPRGRRFWKQSLLPNLGFRFVALPAAFLPLGPIAATNVLLNTLAAEAIGNVHAFLIIGPNHTADDLYRFDEPVRSRPEFLLRQILGSANYRTGSDLVDWPQMWLNYQIEHHLWPDMTMLQVRRAQPRVKALCEKYGVPYVEENVFRRARRMMDVLSGRKAMRWARTSPPAESGDEREEALAS
ncbi:MAG: fatty acid desaturase [Deltaproteobacteria bacterium]|nr:MAG: fatty acid desaturase [Deltaproteobacteria bacterium]